VGSLKVLKGFEKYVTRAGLSPAQGRLVDKQPVFLRTKAETRES
jgi:hypothetical protein